jgi:hypothetical protein
MNRKRRKPRSASSQRPKQPQSGESRSTQEKLESQSSVGQEWATAFAQFRTEHEAWWTRVATGDPAYRLPEQIIAELAKDAGKRKPPLLEPEEVSAERAFLRLCERRGDDVVGIWHGSAVHYPMFVSVTRPPLSEEFISAANWGVSLKDIEAETTDAIGKMDGDRHQQLGYAGELTFDEDYQKERTRLIELSRTFAASLIWPLYATSCEQPSILLRDTAQAVLPKPAKVARFFGELKHFLRKHQLAGMATWDLPLSQGPLEGASLNQSQHLLGPDHVVSTRPTYYDIPSGVDLRGETRAQQRRAAQQVGIRHTHPLIHLSARDGRGSTPETAFQMWFLERIVRNR